jgi:DNA-directed RNA polymerase subunit H (RpoH/RPB5)
MPNTKKMHILQPKHTKLNEKEAQELLKKYNISKSQIPKIIQSDAALENMNCQIGDIIKIERVEEDKVNIYFRVVVA